MYAGVDFSNRTATIYTFPVYPGTMTTIANDPWAARPPMTIARRVVEDGRCQCYECRWVRIRRSYADTMHDLLERKGPEWGWWSAFNEVYSYVVEWSDAQLQRVRTQLQQMLSAGVRRRQKRRQYLQHLRSV